MNMLKGFIPFFIIVFLYPLSADALEKRISIDLTTQHLVAYEQDLKVYEFAISSEKPWTPTPVGIFKPTAKILSTRMRGGSMQAGTYYDLPNVPHVIYFYQGYAIHGAYWHNNFGVPMSHGCINVAPDNMALLYNWVDYKTTIYIAGITPQ